ncbi:MAG: alpha-1,2-fucosyltransferase [Parachlamydia sp.]|nr:MAG: alpha-1,2-fucosyltransferase [Parachlamydia sp.]
MSFIKICIGLMSICPMLLSKPAVVPTLNGQLGNQMFEIAAALSIALDHDAELTVPDLNLTQWGIPQNKEAVFWRIHSFLPNTALSVYVEPEFRYSPIPYSPNMRIQGFFQSEKYFAKHKEAIIDIFSPKQSILDDLTERYSEIVDHPESVAIHIRTYIKDDPTHAFYHLNGREYVKRAMEYFPENAYYIVFSDNIPWCKQELAGLSQNMRFMEGDSYLNDFYLMTLCKNHIISNSSFSWWAAYLNRDPNKLVIAPIKWFTERVGHNTCDLIPDEWILIDN